MLTWLTANGKYKLRFDLQSRNTGNWYYAEYSTFRVLSEAHNYTLQVGGFSGNAGHGSSARSTVTTTCIHHSTVQRRSADSGGRSAACVM